ncbi:tetratricopeptide repeat-containing glycosyltransferase family protein [Helicobacter sp. 11S03491-1]|uniref:tetratricopeptide repeat-containing glycosyltransferase family protein n=1 Tax=Helicobacter sp. 11S03491-1 TaxID=1476196 RepID=UPI000BA74E58|nr:tetratricopeptide repeat-containing glycosyltransferase family protein [Helicobacter sp. 11S03491-1]PAF42913.1 hypothetical protein BKH45_02255 [Helicobacter sp. 11S03491-1]
MNNHFSAAIAAYQHQEYQECIIFCTKILTQNSSDFETWKLCAFALFALGKILKGIEYLEHALNICPDDLSGWVGLGEMYRQNHQPQKTIEILSSFLPSDFIHLHFNLARAYSDLEDVNQAIKHYKIVLDICPDDLEAMYNLGNQFLKISDFKSAIQEFQKASNLGHEDAKINLAYAYNAHFQEEKALEIYESLKISHSKDAYFYFNYANTLRYALRHEESKIMYQKAIALLDDPVFSLNYAYLLLSLGEYKEGFIYYQKRLLLPNVLPLNISHADSDKILLKDKSILIYYEQGFGDSIMFARFLDKPGLIAKDIQILPQTPLFELFAWKWGVCVRENPSKITPYDIAISLPSLPYALGIHEVGLSQKSSQILPLKIRKIGIFFSSHPDFMYSKDKSIPIKMLLECLEGFEVYSLQIEGIDERLCNQFGVVDLSPKIKNFKDTLRELKKLDLLISADSAIVHLAGSYHIPTIVLLHKRYDWRWGKLGQTGYIKSDWYESVIGLAQQEAKNWESVFENLKRYLKNV